MIEKGYAVEVPRAAAATAPETAALEPSDERGGIPRRKQGRGPS
jgi:hypothetical protein